MQPDDAEVRRLIEVPGLVKSTVLFPVHVDEIADEMAFHAGAGGERALRRMREFLGKNRLRTRLAGDLAFLILLMQLQPFGQRQFDAGQAESNPEFASRPP